MPAVFAADNSNELMDIHTIGDLPESDARAFFEWRLQFSVQEEEVPPLDDVSWTRIFEVCGGNAARLKEVAFFWKGAATLEEGTAAPKGTH